MRNPAARVLASLPGDDYGASERSEWLDVDWTAHHRWLRLDGRRLSAVDMGTGPAVVLVHGLGGCWQNWLENIPPLARSHRVVAYDLPGFGKSEMPPWDITIERYGRALFDVLDALEIERATIVGNSMGGFIGAEAAIRVPDRVERLVLVSAAIFWQEYRRQRPLLSLARMTEALVARGAATGVDLVAKRRRLRMAALASGGILFPQRLSRELGQELVRGSGRTRGWLPALEALADYRIREELPKIACPTLVVWGRHDPLVSVRDAHNVAELIPGARKIIFERTGHAPMIERPTRFDRVLEEFLAGDATPGEEQAGVHGEATDGAAEPGPVAGASGGADAAGDAAAGAGAGADSPSGAA